MLFLERCCMRLKTGWVVLGRNIFIFLPILIEEAWFRTPAASLLDAGFQHCSKCLRLFFRACLWWRRVRLRLVRLLP